jgi:putative transposase
LAYLGVTNVFALPRLLPMSSQENDAEILALRHQLLLVLQRQLGPDRVRFTPSDRALLALLHGLPRNVLKRLRRVVRPDTVLRWHRDMLPRRHARRSRPARSGWQRTVRSIRVLVLRLVRENPGPGSTRRLSAVPSRGLVSCVPRLRPCWPATSWRRSPCPGHGCMCLR